MTHPHRRLRAGAAVLLVAALLGLREGAVSPAAGAAPAVASAPAAVRAADAPPGPRSGRASEQDAGIGRVQAALVRGSWVWPLPGRRVIARTFLAPPHAYGPGHRGVDLRADGGGTGGADPLLEVLAPGDGVIAFAGTVADRPLLTIDHGGGLVSTLEPVEALVEAGSRVRRGMRIGTLAAGGHASPGSLHLGARAHGEYVNPLLFLGGVQRARLLPLD